MKYRIDSSPASALGICECGERVIGVDRPEARRLLAAHEARSHPGEYNARDGHHHCEAKTRRRAGSV